MRQYSLYILFIIFLFAFLYSCKNEPIYGCIDITAVNFNMEANTMQDSTCIIVEKKKITLNKKKTNITFDTKKYSDVQYLFIYAPIRKWKPGMSLGVRENLNDTIKKIKKYYNGKFERKQDNLKSLPYHYHHHTIREADTLIITISQDNNPSKRVFLSDKDYYLNVVEKISGFEPKKYKIDIINEGTNLINPKSHFRYKTETATYSTMDYFPSSPDIKKYNGFYINIPKKIDYWYRDFPDTITIQTFRDTGFGIETKMKITRY